MRTLFGPLIAGLDQEYLAAESTCEHLATTTQALQARYADANRRLSEITGGDSPAESEQAGAQAPVANQSVEDELAALKRELGQS